MGKSLAAINVADGPTGSCPAGVAVVQRTDCRLACQPVAARGRVSVAPSPSLRNRTSE
jgi:hypothetical protein